MLENVISVLHELGSSKYSTLIDMGEWGEEIGKWGQKLQKIGQETFSKTFLHTIIEVNVWGQTLSSKGTNHMGGALSPSKILDF